VPDTGGPCLLLCASVSRVFRSGKDNESAADVRWEAAGRLEGRDRLRVANFIRRSLLASFLSDSPRLRVEERRRVIEER